MDQKVGHLKLGDILSFKVCIQNNVVLCTHYRCLTNTFLYLIYDVNSLVGLGRFGQQPFRYVFDIDVAYTIRIQYDTHVHDLSFQNQEFWISTTK